MAKPVKDQVGRTIVFGFDRSFIECAGDRPGSEPLIESQSFPVLLQRLRIMA